MFFVELSFRLFAEGRGCSVEKGINVVVVYLHMAWSYLVVIKFSECLYSCFGMHLRRVTKLGVYSPGFLMLPCVV